MGVRKRADGGAARDTNLAKLLPRGFEVRILLRKRTMEFTQAYPVNESECVSRDCGIVGRIEGLLHALPVGTVGKADAKNRAVRSDVRCKSKAQTLENIGVPERK